MGYARVGRNKEERQQDQNRAYYRDPRFVLGLVVPLHTLLDETRPPWFQGYLSTSESLCNIDPGETVFPTMRHRGLADKKRLDSVTSSKYTVGISFTTGFAGGICLAHFLQRKAV